MDELPNDMLRLLFEQLNGKALLCLSKTNQSLRAFSRSYIKVLTTDQDYYQAALRSDYLSIVNSVKPYHPQILMGAYRVADLFIIKKFKAFKTMDYFNAIINATKGGHLFLLKELLPKAREKYDYITMTQNPFFWTVNAAFNIVCVTGNIEIFELLLPIWDKYYMSFDDRYRKVKLICKHGHEYLIQKLGASYSECVSYYTLGAGGNVDFDKFIRIVRFLHITGGMNKAQSNEDWFIDYLSASQDHVRKLINFMLGIISINYGTVTNSMKLFFTRKDNSDLLRLIQNSVSRICAGNMHWLHD